MGPAITSTATTPESVAPARARPFVPAARQFWFLLAAYFVVQIITRTLVTEAAGIDEADQLVRGQHLSWGYGPQAPLYTWLMTFFLHAFGSSVFSLALLRELMLFGIYALTYLNARALTRSHMGGVVAALMLQFYPTIVWESQRELTHSIAASCMVLLTLLGFQGLGGNRPWMYVAFGLSGGLAILSKYNAGLVYGALLVSALSIRSLRGRVVNWRIALAIGTTILVVLPNAVWMLGHRSEASSSMYKFGIHASMAWWPAVRTGLWEWVETAGLHVLPMILLFAALFWGPWSSGRGRRAASDEAKWLGRVFLLLNAFVLMAIFCFKVTAFKDRWMQPLFVWLPILLVVVAMPHLNGWRLQSVMLAGAVVTVVMAAVIPGRLLFTEERGRRDVLNAPFRRFASDLTGPIKAADCVIANDYWLAGNLVLRFPGKPVYSIDLNPPPGQPRNALLTWDASRQMDLPRTLSGIIPKMAATNWTVKISYLDEKWKFHKSKVMRLGIAHLE